MKLPRRLKLILSGLKVPPDKVHAKKRGFALVHSNGSEHVINLSKVQTPSQWDDLERGLKQVFDKAGHTCSD